MEGRTSDEHTFRRNDQVVTVGTKSSIKIDGEEAQVDPHLFFQRLVIVVQTDELESAFKQKLCSYSSALFDSTLLLREAHKPALADVIWVLLGPDVQADVPNKASRCLGRGGGHSFNESHDLEDLQMHRQPVYTEYVTHMP